MASTLPKEVFETLRKEQPEKFDWLGFYGAMYGKTVLFSELRELFRHRGGNNESNLRRKVFWWRERGLVKTKHVIIDGKANLQIIFVPKKRPDVTPATPV